MDTGHAGQKRKDTVKHDLVFAEKTLVAFKATINANGNDHNREHGAPPTVEQGGVVRFP